MYIPNHYLNTDKNDMITFIKKYSFGTIVTAEDNIPVATHLPFLVRSSDDRIIVSSHFAKANPQADTLAEKEVLVIFSEPHAYISPRFYEKEQNVPTWNYLAVHAYGKATIIDDEAGKFTLLEEMILHYEDEYFEQWKGLSETYKLKMLKGITAFEIIITNIQGKKKLSQNKTAMERQNIMAAFSHSSNPHEVQLAEYMKLTENE